MKGWRWASVLEMHPSPIPHVRQLPEFLPLVSLDRSNWPRCLMWHGWLPRLCLYREQTPGLLPFGQLASCALEWCGGAYPADNSGYWTTPDFWDADDLALEVTDELNIWTDGSLEDYPVGGFEVAGAGVYLPAPELASEGAVWGGGGGVWRCYAGALPCFYVSP